MVTLQQATGNYQVKSSTKITTSSCKNLQLTLTFFKKKVKKKLIKYLDMMFFDVKIIISKKHISMNKRKALRTLNFLGMGD